MSNFYDSVYPKDLSMSMDSNHIQGEIKEFSNVEDRIFVPNGGPFYVESLELRDNNGTLLRPELDYKLLYLNETATVESGRDVVTVIWVLVDTVVSVALDYRVVGGEFSNTVYAILQELKRSGPINRNVDWHTNVFNKPVQFPAAPHYHTPESFTDWEMVYKQLEGIRLAIQGGDLAAWQSHYNYLRLLFKGMTDNLDTALGDYVTKDTIKDYYTKVEIDDMMASSDAVLKQILDVLIQMKDCCCDGTGGNNGGNNNAEKFTLTSFREGDDIVYTVNSNKPDSVASAPYRVVESRAAAELFAMSAALDGNDIIYTVSSDNPTSTTAAPYMITEFDTDSETESYVIQSRQEGSKMVYDIVSNKPASNTLSNYTITETGN